jgi:chromosome segregation ATPase
LQDLKQRLEGLLAQANNIEDTGISSQYDDTFAGMESQIKEVRSKLESINITKEDVDELRKQIDLLQSEIEVSRGHLTKKNDHVTNVSSSVDLAEAQLKNLEEKVKKYTSDAQSLKDRANDIRRSDTKGAHALIKEGSQKAQAVQHKYNNAVDKLNAAETERAKAEQLLNDHDKDFNVHYQENQNALQNIERGIAKLEETIPNLNAQVCGGEAAQCDEMCGGPSAECGHCGGESCGGSVSKANQAREFALEAEEKLREKQKEAQDVWNFYYKNSN